MTGLGSDPAVAARSQKLLGRVSLPPGDRARLPQQRRSLVCAKRRPEHLQHSTDLDAPKQTNDG
jgi:hypothetical protein